MSNLDHDYLCTLLKDAPEEFEICTSKIINDYINHSPDYMQVSLRQLQWKIDGLKYSIKDPMVRLIKIQEMIFENIKLMQDKFRGLSQ